MARYIACASCYDNRRNYDEVGWTSRVLTGLAKSWMHCDFCNYQIARDAAAVAITVYLVDDPHGAWEGDYLEFMSFEEAKMRAGFSALAELERITDVRGHDPGRATNDEKPGGPREG